MPERTITCFCEHVMEAPVPETIDLTTQPEVLDQIIEGEFLSFTCEKCGKKMKPEFQVALYDTGKNIDILLIPELERATFLTGKNSYNANRVVIGYTELSEKAIILKHNLDDRVVEIIKYLLLEKSNNPDKTSITFAGMEHGTEQPDKQKKLLFHVHGLHENEVGVTRIPMDLYDKIEKDLPKRMEEEPFKEITTPPYVSINNITMEVD